MLCDARMLRAFPTGTGRTILETIPVLPPLAKVVLDASQTEIARSLPRSCMVRSRGEQWMAVEGLRRQWDEELTLQFWMFGMLGRFTTILGIYDLLPLRLGTLKGRMLLSRLRRVRSRGDIHVFTLAEHTRQRLIEQHSLPAERVRALHPGADHLVASLGRYELTSRRHDPYYLAIGRISQHKGTDRLVRAWCSGPKPAGLVLVLPPQDAIGSRARKWTQKGVVIRHSLTMKELALLAHDAVAIVCPSEEEGYGLPLGEAATLGRPVIASDIPVYHEMGVGPIRWVATNSLDAWREAIADPNAWLTPARWITSPPTWDGWRVGMAQLIADARG